MFVDGLRADQLREMTASPAQQATAQWPPPRYWPAVGIAAIVLLVATLLPFGHVGGLLPQDRPAVNVQIYFWDLLPQTLGLLAVPAALGVAWYLARAQAASIAAVAIVFVAVAAGNTYLASALADRDTHQHPLPALTVPERTTPRCDPSGDRTVGNEDLVPTFSCAFGLDGPVNELEGRSAAAGGTALGLPAMYVGVGPRLFVLLTGLLGLWSAWILLRYRLSPIASALVMAAAIGALLVVAAVDWVSHLE
jgi:hypothetical protein